MLELLKKIQITDIDKKILELTKLKEKKYTWLEKNITKKKEYQDFIKNISIIEENIDKLNTQRKKYEKALTIESLDLSFNEVISLLKEHNAKPIITQNDLEIYEDGIPYHPLMDTKDIIYVHKGGHVPNNSTLISVKESGSKSEFAETIGDKTFNINLTKARETIHFSANGEVGSHMEGNWDDKKYAILIPYSEMPKEKIVQAPCYDTYIKGSIKLTNNTYILVPSDEIETVETNNPGVNVIGYDGPNVTGYANALISILGYNRYAIGPHEWYNKTDEKKYNELMTKEGFQLSSHSDTKEFYQEKFSMRLEYILNIINEITNNLDYMNNEKFVYELREKIISLLRSIQIPINYTIEEYYNDLILYFNTIGIKIQQVKYDTKYHIDSIVAEQLIEYLKNFNKTNENTNHFKKS